jgi:hypothetical protein
MSDDPKTAVRIITDLTMPSKEKLARGRGDIVFTKDLNTEIEPLVKADLALAGMLDELDEKANAIARGVVEVNQASTESILALQQRCAELEARTFGNRVKRLVDRVDAWIVALVVAIDSPDGVACPTCEGRGRVIHLPAAGNPSVEPCFTCRGSGRVSHVETAPETSDG